MSRKGFAPAFQLNCKINSIPNSLDTYHIMKAVCLIVKLKGATWV